MPCISDPGEELVRECHEHGVEIESVPGPSAAITALCMSGLDTSRFSFEGFLSVTKKQRDEHLDEIKDFSRTLIFYEAPHKLKNTLDDLYRVLGNRQIALCRELTKIHEEVIKGTISEMIERYKELTPRGEYVLVIAGKSREQLKAEARKQWENMSVAEHVQMYMSQGMDKKEAMKAAAKDRGVSKRDIYQELEGKA